jgi:hypothetical protein
MRNATNPLTVVKSTMSTTPDTVAPIHRETLGPVEAAVWSSDFGNEAKPRIRVTLTKAYKDADGIWRRTDALDVEDLPFAVQVLERCNTWAIAQRQTAAQVVAQVGEANPLEEYLHQGQQEKREQRTHAFGR